MSKDRVITGDICPCCNKPLPEWRNYSHYYNKCMTVVMK